MSHHTGFRPTLPAGNGIPPPHPLSAGMAAAPPNDPFASQSPASNTPLGTTTTATVSSALDDHQQQQLGYGAGGMQEPRGQVMGLGSTPGLGGAVLQPQPGLPPGMMSMTQPRKSRNPRVVHRHLYLWIEDQIEKNKSVPGLMVIESLETFYREVLDANEGNEQFNFEKLLELAQKQPPVSLLYDRTLNTSTNVLKRWNNTNGMLNWFLHKIGRPSTPDAAEVVQLARVHVARNVLKKQRTSIITIAEIKAKLGDAYSTSSLAPPPPPPPAGGVAVEGGGGMAAAGASSGGEPSSVLGKRKADGRPIGGLAHVEGTSKKQLYENLKNMYPGVQKKAVFDAVDGDAWVYHDEGSFSPNPIQLVQWSDANGLWQHFAAYCRNENIKHDVGLFGGDPDQPKEKSGGGGGKKVANAVGPPMLMPGQWGGKGGKQGGGGKPEGQRKGPEAADMSRMVPAVRTPYTDHFDSTVAVLQNNLKARVEAFGSDQMPIQYIDCKKYGWDASVLAEWQKRGVELGTPDLVVLTPYVVLVRNDNSDTGEQGSTLKTLFGKGGAPPAEVRQFGVYTFKYGTGGFFLHVSVSLVISSRNPRTARFSGKYIISNPADVMLPCDCGPVSLSRTGPPELPPEEELEERGLHYLIGGVSASQDEKYTELFEKAKSQNTLIMLDEVMNVTAGATQATMPVSAASVTV